MSRLGHKSVRRVEVPFERVMPPANEFWTSSTRTGLDVPIGRAGATKLQYLRLGKGTSQHVLIAGKTGSGKSSLLHALITNAALHYSPDEVEFYLIDFKKGVEFKTYATHRLPHARVIAIESDREFGVSVLQRLDNLLKDRGEMFRRVGVQDLQGYRDARPNEPLPRVLLVIDEFQEFFIEDDSLSQSAALLFDRLIRQGRAFGIHVLLGSQTLAGAYSLARSTLGQIAVRIALQCSDTDAHLILSEENTAARLLTRPGEAIYNDANGLVEGNHPFQVVWLDDSQRETYLDWMRPWADEFHKRLNGTHSATDESRWP
jgi:S-DNA-T family DNA segregation ATPase FtsK/SpoIIIE